MRACERSVRGTEREREKEKYGGIRNGNLTEDRAEMQYSWRQEETYSSCRFVRTDTVHPWDPIFPLLLILPLSQRIFHARSIRNEEDLWKERRRSTRSREEAERYSQKSRPL